MNNGGNYAKENRDIFKTVMRTNVCTVRFGNSWEWKLKICHKSMPQIHFSISSIKVVFSPMFTQLCPNPAHLCHFIPEHYAILFSSVYSLLLAE